MLSFRVLCVVRQGWGFRVLCVGRQGWGFRVLCVVRQVWGFRVLCGETGVEFHEDSLPGSGEPDKKVYYCSGRMLIITDKSQQNLRFFSVKV